MIFSQIFSPNYKSSDPEKRILSIEKLNEDAEKDKSILHELAFNDASDLVSLAALNKLNSFVLWMKSAETSHSPRIRKQAQQICQSQLEDETIVSDKLFLA
ncbi:MAG: exonuclease SbcC, partial [Yoonia sp.]